MDLKHIKKQIDQGVIISKVQWKKVLEAALLMEETLKHLEENEDVTPDAVAEALDILEDM